MGTGADVMELLLLAAAVVVHIPFAELASLLTAVSVLGTAWLANKKRTQIADKQEVAADKVAAKAGVVADKVTVVAENVANSDHSTTVKLDEIHLLVNSRLTEALDRIKGLEGALGIGPKDPVPTVTEVSDGKISTTPPS